MFYGDSWVFAGEDYIELINDEERQHNLNQDWYEGTNVRMVGTLPLESEFNLLTE